MSKVQYVFFETNSYVEEETQEVKIDNIVAIRTNEEFKIMSYFQSNASSPISQMHEFEKWVKTPFSSKFISFDVEVFNSLIESLKKANYKASIKDFDKIMKYQFWNIKSELCYRMNLPSEMTLEGFLKLYGITFLGDINNKKDRCYNLFSLVSLYKLDTDRNRELFVRNKIQKQEKKISTESNSNNSLIIGKYQKNRSKYR